MTVKGCQYGSGKKIDTNIFTSSLMQTLSNSIQNLMARIIWNNLSVGKT
jgi:hypothetical protein